MQRIILSLLGLMMAAASAIAQPQPEAYRLYDSKGQPVDFGTMTDSLSKQNVAQLLYRLRTARRVCQRAQTKSVCHKRAKAICQQRKEQRLQHSGFSVGRGSPLSASAASETERERADERGFRYDEHTPVRDKVIVQTAQVVLIFRHAQEGHPACSRRSNMQ